MELSDCHPAAKHSVSRRDRWNSTDFQSVVPRRESSLPFVECGFGRDEVQITDRTTPPSTRTAVPVTAEA
jgi:hypothetical protein